MDHGTRIAIDVGGTFTDVVRLDLATGALRFEKVPTTTQAPTEGVLAAFAAAGVEPGAVSMFNHGTTLGLNALLTRTGARVAIVTTRGFRDVYLLGRTDRNVSYDITYRKPPALLERRDTFEVTERSWFDGTVGTPLDVEDARAVATRIAEGGYDAVAVAFLHAYANPANELAMRDVLAEVAPGVAVSLSHELSREYREYERTSTAVLDAYIKPIVRTYLEVLEGRLAQDGFAGRFLVSRSGGGAMTVTSAKAQPANLILSGPAGGVVGATAFSRLIGVPDLITIDMGGTSLDASLVLDHQPLMHQGAQFEGMPLNISSLNIQTIGAGGGSLAWLDDAGALQVGPASAGAVPGPAAYGRGGTQPTFTDAAVVVGHLGGDSPLGGTLRLDEELSRGALKPIADELNMGLEELARGILQISVSKITGAVRAITVENGLDPSGFALLSFGGGGGLVAVDVAHELGIPRVIVPPGQGAFSALGMLMADVQHDYARTVVTPLAEFGEDRLRHVEAIFAGMETEAGQALADEGFTPGSSALTRSLDVRYSGQEHAVSVPAPAVGPGFVDDVARVFADLHLRQYGHVQDAPVEITTFRVRAVGLIEDPELPVVARRGSGAPQPFGHRPVHTATGPVEYALHLREDLLAGDEVTGPAVVVEHTATTVLHAGDVLTVGRLGELVIDIATTSEGERA
ncbi:hydantoinase/oxoprolinase family protein [Kineococcus sp. SYSU DK003]|uniref:hydantoinase/oxoprolinase family protein n=1 Tax=Kineococcus sp. SYSU DK003 TaxID=3383124 RepID=UPI003D7CDDF7